MAVWPNDFWQPGFWAVEFWQEADTDEPGLSGVVVSPFPQPIFGGAVRGGRKRYYSGGWWPGK